MKKKNITSDPEAMQELKAKVDVIVLKELQHVSASQLTEKADIVKDLGADSLDQQLIAFAVEEAFDIEVDELEVEKLITLSDIYQYVASKLEETA